MVGDKDLIRRALWWCAMIADNARPGGNEDGGKDADKPTLANKDRDVVSLRT